MKQISTTQIQQEIARLCREANYFLGEDIKKALEGSLAQEEQKRPRAITKVLLENAQIAQEQEVPMCQDTGMVVVFLDLGQDLHITGGSLEEAVNRGVQEGYEKGYLRKSVVADPIRRVNTQTNTPAVIHYRLVPGEELSIALTPKGFGSENMSRLGMLKPSDGLEGVEDFVVETVRIAEGNPCPPIIVGVGVGGTMEQAALLAKRSLLRRVDSSHPDPFWAAIEKRLLGKINALGIGPAGLGGTLTALAVFLSPYATHIAGLPVAVNISCHATRHVERTLQGEGYRG